MVRAVTTTVLTSHDSQRGTQGLAVQTGSLVEQTAVSEQIVVFTVAVVVTSAEEVFTAAVVVTFEEEVLAGSLEEVTF